MPAQRHDLDCHSLSIVVLHTARVVVRGQGTEYGLVIEGRVVVFFEFGTLSSMLIRLLTGILKRHTLSMHHNRLLWRGHLHLRGGRFHHWRWSRPNTRVHGRLRWQRLLRDVRWLSLRRLLLGLCRVDDIRVFGSIASCRIDRGLLGSSSTRTWTASDGVLCRVDLPGIVTQGAICLSLLLSPTKALEVLAGIPVSLCPCVYLHVHHVALLSKE